MRSKQNKNKNEKMGLPSVEIGEVRSKISSAIQSGLCGRR